MDGRARKLRWLAAVGAALLLVVALWQVGVRTGTWTVAKVADRQVVARVETPAVRTGSRGRPDGVGRYALDYELTYEAPAVQGGRATAELHWQAEWQVAPLPGMPGWLGVRTLPGQWQANVA